MSGTRSNREWTADVSTHKAIQALLVFKNERQEFMTWNEKMINAFSRVHRNSHYMLKEMNKRWANSTDSELIEKLDVKALFKEINDHAPESSS